MALHDFILQEVRENSPRLEEVGKFELPSALFVGVDPETCQLLVKEGIRDRGEGPEIEALFSQGYKHWRRQYALEEPFRSSKIRYFVDFEDARYTPRRALYGFDFNVFQYNRRKGDRSSVLWSLPNYFEPGRGVGHPPRGTMVDSIDYEDKIPRVYWRGGISGIHWVGPGTQEPIPKLSEALMADGLVRSKYSRIAAVARSSNRAVIDARFAGSTVGRMADSTFSESAYVAEHVHANEMMQYRYLLCPKGNDVSSALYWVIRTNSIAFKEESTYETIPDYFLEPWVHYVPILPGLADLEEKYEYCERHQDLMKRIVVNAQAAYRQITDRDLWDEAKNVVFERLGMA